VPSTAQVAPRDHEPPIGGARWRSMGELRLGRSVMRSFCGWTYRQGTVSLFLAAVQYSYQAVKN
jgi:hypothetical protein